MEWKFLEISLDGRDVLVNSSEFASSAILRGVEKIDGGGPYLDSVGQSGGLNLVVFDLRGFASALFSQPPEAGGAERKEAIVVDVSGFSEGYRTAFRGFIEKLDREISTAMMFVRVGSSLQLTGVPLSQLRLLPGGIRGRCRASGLVAMRFRDDGRPQYLLDIETVVLGSLRAR